MKTLLRALALAAWALSGGAAHALYLSDNGIGQALVYPYYTVRAAGGNAFNTYLSIVNGDSRGKALRVRFREGRAGREVAGFNLFLDAQAMWTAAIVPAGEGARLITADTACASPAFAAAVPPATFASLEFSDASYAGINGDAFGAGLERVREGYFEVLEMASLPGETLESCASARDGLLPSLAAPRGGLYGTLTLINVESGLDFTSGAEALAELATRPYYRAPSDPYPDFTATEIDAQASFMLDGRQYRLGAASPVAALEAALVRGTILNEIVLDRATLSATDWVLTLPTRRFHTDARPSPWFASATAAISPIRLRGAFTPRNGRTLNLLESCGLSCQADDVQVEIRLPWAATVLGFAAAATASGAEGTTAALGSRNGWIVSLPTEAAGGQLAAYFHNVSSGQPHAGVNTITTRMSDGTVTSQRIELIGLPVVGFMARTLRNGALSCEGGTCQGNYGGSAPHRLRRAADPALPAQ